MRALPLGARRTHLVDSGQSKVESLGIGLVTVMPNEFRNALQQSSTKHLQLTPASTRSHL
jgi:hypothetical protein